MDRNVGHPPACKVRPRRCPRNTLSPSRAAWAGAPSGPACERPQPAMGSRKAGSGPQGPRPTGARGWCGHVGLMGILASAPCGACPPPTLRRACRPHAQAHTAWAPRRPNWTQVLTREAGSQPWCPQGPGKPIAGTSAHSPESGHTDGHRPRAGPPREVARGWRWASRAVTRPSLGHRGHGASAAQGSPHQHLTSSSWQGQAGGDVNGLGAEALGPVSTRPRLEASEACPLLPGAPSPPPWGFTLVSRLP